MANEYVKTSKEELTAMADELRAVGPFQEGQEFVFPSSDYDEDPIYTYKIVDNGAWSEITQAEAIELINQGYSSQQVTEFPAIGEADVNTVYFTIKRQLGFMEAYQELLDDFYDKILYGTLEQKDLDGVVYSEPLKFFGTYTGTLGDPSFPDITEITLDKEILKEEIFNRLHYLEKVNIVNDSKNIDYISEHAFNNCNNLEEINIQPAELKFHCFRYCLNLKFGEGYLNLANCTKYRYGCLDHTPITILPIAADAENVIIEGNAFYFSNLEEIYLPDIPATLTNISAFSNISSNFKFKVTSSTVKDAYLAATNWSSFDASKFEVITS